MADGKDQTNGPENTDDHNEPEERSDREKPTGANEGPEHPLRIGDLDRDHDLIEKLRDGRIQPRDVPPELRGTEDEIIAMIAAWVAEVRPEILARYTNVSAEADSTIPPAQPADAQEKERSSLDVRVILIGGASGAAMALVVTLLLQWFTR